MKSPTHRDSPYAEINASSPASKNVYEVGKRIINPAIAETCSLFVLFKADLITVIEMNPTTNIL